MGAPAQGLARLRAATSSGELDALCASHHIRVLTVYGSAARGEGAARDLDIGVITEGADLDVVTLTADLMDLTGTDRVDLAHLNRAGPVLKERALVGSIGLYEGDVGALATAQAAAIGERIDTDPMRRLDLELLSR
jgi:predicted nucleotidyltransferase